MDPLEQYYKDNSHLKPPGQTTKADEDNFFGQRPEGTLGQQLEQTVGKAHGLTEEDIALLKDAADGKII